MITSFDDAFTALIGDEGVYVDNPADPGGETMYGVTKRVAVANGYTGDMRSLPLATAKAIAKSQYWAPYQCDQFDPRIGFLVFDAAYNGGHPAVWLQNAVGATPDGSIGAATIAAVRSADPLKTCMRFTAYHLQYYSALHNLTFVDGWVNRVAANMLTVTS